MRIIHDLGEMTETARGWLAGGTVGFVPTMGYLCEEHLGLVRAARQECQISVVSIFVNPLQFDNPSEARNYPRDLPRDLHLLDTAQVDIVFIPRVEDFCPPSLSTFVTPSSPVVQQLEASSNPVYARGVATIMIKLLQLVRPDVAYFGQRDALQVAIVRQLVRDLNVDVTLRILPIIRDSDNIALSSRNRILTPAERQAAQVVYRALLAGKTCVESGERQRVTIEKTMADIIATEPLARLDYATVCDPDTLSELPETIPKAMLAIAVHIGTIRLTDNIVWRGDGDWLL
jgi:pantoate--beta-alanine ligase